MGHALDGKLKAASIDARNAPRIAEVMQALSATSRVLILGRLRESPCSVGELVDAVGMGQPAVSQQLRLLRQLGLVRGRRDGRRTVYALHDSHVGVLLDEALYHVEHLRLDDRDEL